MSEATSVVELYFVFNRVVDAEGQSSWQRSGHVDTRQTPHNRRPPGTVETEWQTPGECLSASVTASAVEIGDWMEFLQAHHEQCQALADAAFLEQVPYGRLS